MITLDGHGPLHLQVYQSTRRAILTGSYRAGSRVPASRPLAAELGVSRNVVLQAFDQLTAEGYLEGRVGAGSFVASPLPESPFGPHANDTTSTRRDRPVRLSRYGRRALAQCEPSTPPSRPALRVDFRYGLAPPDATGLTVWRRLVARTASHVPLDYAPTQGDRSLRTQLAHHLRAHRAVTCDPDQVVVVTGSQQALDLTARLLLDPGDRVIIEDPHYQGARRAFLAAGAILTAIPVDRDGLDLASRRTARRRARLAYVTPSHQFPTGVIMPLARRLALLAWAERHDAFILEDDYDSEYRYEGRPVESVHGLDANDRTIYVGTFSKVLFPSVRLGFVVLPKPLVPVFLAGKWIADRHSPILEQVALAEFLGSGQFNQHLRRMRRRLAGRRAALIDAIERELGDAAEVMGTSAGIHLVLWLRHVPSHRTAAIVDAAARLGVGLYSIAPYYVRPPAGAGFLMGYGSLEVEAIREGVRILARAMG